MLTNYLQSKCRKFENKIKDDEENVARFYDPPSSCKELGMLGYTLNGYYLVENGDWKIKKKEGDEIELIFCRFQLQAGTKGVMTKQIISSACCRISFQIKITYQFKYYSIAKMEERVGFLKIVNKSHSKSILFNSFAPTLFVIRH